MGTVICDESKAPMAQSKTTAQAHVSETEAKAGLSELHLTAGRGGGLGEQGIVTATPGNAGIQVVLVI